MSGLHSQSLKLLTSLGGNMYNSCTIQNLSIHGWSISRTTQTNPVIWRQLKL